MKTDQSKEKPEDEVELTEQELENILAGGYGEPPHPHPTCTPLPNRPC